MSIFKDKLTKLESHLQTLIEGSAARLFPSDIQQEDLAHRLILAMEAEIRTQPDGQVIAPNLYTLVIHPLRGEELRANLLLYDDLARAIQDSGEKSGFRFLQPPTVSIEEDPQVPPHDFLVLARIHQLDLTHTTDMEPNDLTDSIPSPENSFLIVDGTHVFPLTEPVINIGRRPDNQLVIGDSRVSRVHAQLRAIRGYYVIFDLNTTGGTLVNDQPIRQCTLYPGDVISLAGLPLIFGQDESEIGETQQYIPTPDG
jgi:hypothetical protein